MSRFLGQRVMQYLLVIFLTISINFFLPRLMPGNPLAYLAGEDVAFLTHEQRVEILAKHGLDKSLGEQYVIYLGNVARGDFGYSYQLKRPIAGLIRERLPWTLLLTLTALIISSLMGVALGAAAAWGRGKTSDVASLTTLMFFSSMPSFWIGMILMVIFGVQLGWLPTFGARSAWLALSGWAYYVDVIRHLILPVVTLVLISVASTFLVMRYSMLNVMGEDYILMARAKGLSEDTIKYKYAVRNALLPMVTMFMLSLGRTVGGATVVETVFSYPGLGRLMYEAVVSRDYPVLQASFFIITITVVLGNLVADLLYPIIDPKVRG